jgi:ribose transport system permease protein
MSVSTNNNFFWEFTRSKLNNKTVMAFVIAFGLYLAGGILSPGFFDIAHVMNILNLASFLGIVALGQTIVILSGSEGIDLSVGAVISLSSVMCSQIINMANDRLIPALAITLIVGFIVGTFNGIGVSVFKIPPLVMTLAMSSVVQGFSLVFTQGQPKGKASDILAALGSGRTGIVSNMLILWVIITIIAVYLLSNTRPGKVLYGIGANNMTAELSGARTKYVRIFAYSISAMISAFAGFLLLGYTGTAYLDIGSMYVMPSVAAVVIGGISLSGGYGSYLGAVGGAIVLTILNSILVSLHSGEGGRQIVYGLMILVVLAFYMRRNET